MKHIFLQMGQFSSHKIPLILQEYIQYFIDWYSIQFLAFLVPFFFHLLFFFFFGASGLLRLRTQPSTLALSFTTFLSFYLYYQTSDEK